MLETPVVSGATLKEKNMAIDPDPGMSAIRKLANHLHRDNQEKRIRTGRYGIDIVLELNGKEVTEFKTTAYATAKELDEKATEQAERLIESQRHKLLANVKFILRDKATGKNIKTIVTRRTNE
jgi:hypothetical protein